MNNVLVDEAELRLVAAQRETNDLFRRTLTDGNLILSAGILAFGAEAQARILDTVRAFDDFDCSDPWDDHSIGDVENTIELPGAEPNTVLVFFKVTECGADGKAALALSLADEWWGHRDAICSRFGEQCNE